MNPYNLPPLPALDQLPAPGQTSTNPGLVNPADQAFPAVRSNADQTQLQSSIASASLTNSNGEQQRLNLNLDAIGSNGVTVSAASVPLVSHSGDSGQRLDHKTADQAPATASGLAVEVFPGAVNHARASLPDISIPLPPAVNLAADTRIRGGLAINVNIR